MTVWIIEYRKKQSKYSDPHWHPIEMRMTKESAERTAYKRTNSSYEFRVMEYNSLEINHACASCHAR